MKPPVALFKKKSKKLFVIKSQKSKSYQQFSLFPYGERRKENR